MTQNDSTENDSDKNERYTISSGPIDSTDKDIGERVTNEPPWGWSDLSGIDATNTSGRSYKCPNCGGEFDRWDKKTIQEGGKKVCPFCGLERRSYSSIDL